MNKDRRNDINKLIQEKGEISLKQLGEAFKDVSSMTLRRDLDFLEKGHQIIRTRGGAKSVAYVSSNIKEERFLKKSLINIEAKSVIAQKAVKLISPGRSIFLDAGTTVMSLAKLIPNERYYIFTSAPNVAMEVLFSTSSTVNLTGGEIDRDNLAVSGVGAVEFMKNVNIDIAFIAVSGFSSQNGFSCRNINDSHLKKAIIERAAKVVVLMDSSKVGINMPYTYARFPEIDILIGDDELPEKFKAEAESYGVQVL